MPVKHGINCLRFHMRRQRNRPLSHGHAPPTGRRKLGISSGDGLLFRGRHDGGTRFSFAGSAAVVILFFFIVGIAAPVRTNAQDAVSEYQVKAAYVFNFLKFVEYPTSSFVDPLAPLIIGVLGDDPFGSALPQVVIGKTVGGRDLVIRIYHPGEDLRSAHILFISSSERKRLPAIFSSLHGSSVLTVGDTTGFLDAGGMIQFLSESDRVRFAINVDAASRARLKLSSKLLSLAKVMGGNGKEAGN